jgi:hypothetical protein
LVEEGFDEKFRTLRRQRLADGGIARIADQQERCRLSLGALSLNFGIHLGPTRPKRLAARVLRDTAS